MTYLHLFFDYTIGSKDEFSLQHRYFNSVILLTTTLILLALMIEQIISINAYTSLIFVFSVILFSFIYFLSRIKKAFKQLIWPFIVLSLWLLHLPYGLPIMASMEPLFIFTLRCYRYYYISRNTRRNFLCS